MNSALALLTLFEPQQRAWKSYNFVFRKDFSWPHIGNDQGLNCIMFLGKQAKSQ